MKRTALLLATLLPVAASADEAPISARTDPPTMSENGGGVLLLDSRDGSDARVQRMGKRLDVVPISTLPESLSGVSLPKTEAVPVWFHLFRKEPLVRRRW
jgi:hypothetical protein